MIAPMLNADQRTLFERLVRSSYYRRITEKIVWSPSGRISFHFLIPINRPIFVKDIQTILSENKQLLEGIQGFSILWHKMPVGDCCDVLLLIGN